MPPATIKHPDYQRYTYGWLLLPKGKKPKLRQLLFKMKADALAAAKKNGQRKREVVPVVVSVCDTTSEHI